MPKIGAVKGKHQVASHACSWSLCWVVGWLQNERVLFHYNGHGVPRPTANGEIWVFNKSYTQYIPMSIYDLQTWVGTPAIYLFDSSAAGLIVNSFKAFAEQRQQVRSILYVFVPIHMRILHRLLDASD